MNAKQAVIENERLVAELVSSAKEMATRLGITVSEAISKKVDFWVRNAKSDTEKAAWNIRGEEAMALLEDVKTYDIHFNDSENSNNKGFAMTSIDEAKGWIAGSKNVSYFSDYRGGTVSVVCNETGETVYEESID